MPAPAPPTRPERTLAFVLRLNGAITALALLAVFMPLDWMADTHRRLGMGPLPGAPIVAYLARTVSFLYFVHGGLCLLLASDVRRFGPVITYVASVELAFAALLLWIDESAGMPRPWTWIEVPAVAAIGALILALRLRAARGGA
jgi:hypothetical protein